MVRKPVFPITVYYDGSCGLCRREMARSKARDANARLRFVDITLPTFDAAREGLAGRNLRTFIHAQDQRGTVVAGVDAFAWIWRACGYAALPALVRIPVIRSIARLCYSLVAKNRYRMSAREKETVSHTCGPECEHKML